MNTKPDKGHGIATVPCQWYSASRMEGCRLSSLPTQQGRMPLKLSYKLVNIPICWDFILVMCIEDIEGLVDVGYCSLFFQHMFQYVVCSCLCPLCRWFACSFGFYLWDPLSDSMLGCSGYNIFPLLNINHPPVVGVLTHVCDHSGLFNIRGVGLPSSSFCCLNMCEHCVPSCQYLTNANTSPFLLLQSPWNTTASKSPLDKSDSIWKKIPWISHDSINP